LVQEIAAASKEQDTGAEQINKALVQLEKSNSAECFGFRGDASTTEELSSQSEQLVSALSFFRTAPMLRRSTVAKPAKHFEAAGLRSSRGRRWQNGLGKVGSGKFDLIVTDLNMPKWTVSR
jgi:methyl-accepting chemotaxis protein